MKLEKIKLACGIDVPLKPLTREEVFRMNFLHNDRKKREEEGMLFFMNRTQELIGLKWRLKNFGKEGGHDE